jgi:excisionase family DNA binding protein
MVGQHAQESIVEEQVAQQFKKNTQNTAAGNMPEKPIGVSEMANILGYSKSHMYKLASKNEIPHAKKGARLIFYMSEVNGWLKN